MQYREGRTGRVFLLKVEDGDDLLAELKDIVVREDVRVAVMFLLGGVGGAAVVVGPKRKEIPPEPQWRSFGDGRELLGIGTVYWGDEGPMIHLHASIGRGDDVLTGCLREKASVYLVAEVIIMEILDTGALRRLDHNLGLHVLGFGRGSEPGEETRE